MLKENLKKLNKAWFVKNSGAVILIVLALILSLYFFFGNSAEDSDLTDNGRADSDEYVLTLEHRLESIITRVDGAGECRVMVMLKEYGTRVYATEEKNSENISGISGSRDETSLETEKSYVIVKTQSSESPVEITEYLPQICGIVVVCRGGGSTSVKNEITELLSALTGLPSSSIHVSRMGK